MTTTENTISAANNPALANQLVKEALSDNQPVAASVGTPTVQLPPDTTVELPGGLHDPFEGTITTAEVRELTGADEEAISKITDTGKSLLAIIERATVKLGDKPATKETLDALLAGDREMILIAIRKVTFGPEFDLGPNCPLCGEEQTFTVDLDKDIEIKTLKDEDREFTVDCKVGKVNLRLPNGVAQKALVNAAEKTAAELDTIHLKSCIISINGMPIYDVQQVRNLSIKDRRELLTAISDRNPGPQLSAVIKTCQSCNQEVPLPISLADLFRG